MTGTVTTRRVTPSGHFSEWPVTFTEPDSLVRLQQFVRISNSAQHDRRCAR